MRVRAFVCPFMRAFLRACVRAFLRALMRTTSTHCRLKYLNIPGNLYPFLLDAESRHEGMSILLLY